jgi:hypothetical protein
MMFRWMSESILMAVYAKTGVLFDELVANYSCVLSPVLAHELVDFLAALGCCTIETQVLVNTTLESPFGSS